MVERTRSKEVQSIRKELKDYREDFPSAMLDSGFSESSDKFRDLIDNIYDLLSEYHLEDEVEESKVEEKLDMLDSRLASLKDKADIVLRSLGEVEDKLYEFEHPKPLPEEKPAVHTGPSSFHHYAPSFGAPMKSQPSGQKWSKPKKKGIIAKIMDFFRNLFKKK